MSLLMLLLQALVLVVALAIDAFVCSFGYGTNKIKIPFRSVLAINGVCTLLLAIGLLIGDLLGGFMPLEITVWTSFLILFFLGMVKIFDSAIKKIIRKHNGINKNFSFSMLNLGFVLNVYANPEAADVDKSKVLSIRESIPLALALGLDGLSVGFGVGIAAINVWLIILLSFVIGVLMILGGSWFGNKVAQAVDLDIGWLSGIILLVIALSGIV
ncbi:MAG: manganese efflux pump [Turicibacter sp.]|nr:manganese efflux pump [Turicibacter sp.]